MTTFTTSELMNDLSAEAAERAYHGTSFSPEKRGESLRSEYASRIQSFAAYLEQEAAQATEEQKDAELARYRENLKAAYEHYIACQSRCISTLIAGPSGFPVARAQRANEAEQRAMQAIIGLGEKARASVRKRYGTPDPNAPIRSGDPDAIERLSAKLESCRKWQERMREGNKAIRAAKGDRAKAIANLTAIGFKEDDACGLLNPDFAGRIGFPAYMLSNNNAEIHRIEKRIRDIESMQAKAESDGGSGEGESGIRFEVDAAAARVKLYFPDKPDEQTRAGLKAHGFRWSPRNKAWQAYVNYRTIRYAREVAGVGDGNE